MEWQLFNILFYKFWQKKTRSLNEKDDDPLADTLKKDIDLEDSQVPVVSRGKETNKNDGIIKETIEMVPYSPVSILEKKDIEGFNTDDIQIAHVIIKNLLSSFKIHKTRRSKGSKRPKDLEFRQTIRQSLKSDGIPLELFYRKKKRRLRKLVVLADVSGSMSRYVGFVLPFLLGLRSVGSRAEVFVFSTSLTPVTNIIRKFDIDQALKTISDTVLDWSGGTKIGYSLHQFREQNERRLLNKRSVVVIISDGWDLGGRVLLKREMETIWRKTYRTVWLNPMASEPGYRPVYQGMRAVLEYIDYFLPANNLQSLKMIGKTLSSIMVER
jgi:uncharacterized protein with von Willebrand factor type A (vWA) domain